MLDRCCGLLTDDRGKTIDDGSSSSTLSTPFSFENCLMPAVELDAARLVGGSEADRSRVLERVHEYLEANASFRETLTSATIGRLSYA